jgi:DNA-nicking Smr family endonuclease
MIPVHCPDGLSEGVILYGLGEPTEMNSDKKNCKDWELFKEAMADVKPLSSSNRIEPVLRNTPPEALQRELDEKAALEESMMPVLDPADLETGEELLYLRPGLQKRILRRLRRGQYSTSDVIDLHHMNQETARQVLLDFIVRSVESGHSCVRIIHGKGLRSKNEPRLKILTNRILQRHPRVAAFASCRPVDGGTGAVDVLLTVKARSAP